MLYQLSDISFEQLIINYSAVFNKKDIVVLNQNLFRNKEDSSFYIDQLSLLSKNLEIIIIARLTIKEVESNIVFSRGEVLGVSVEHLRIDCYRIRGKKYLILINNNIKAKGLDVAIQKAEPDYVLCLLENETSVGIRIAANLAITAKTMVLTLFKESLIVFEKDGSIKNIEIGKLRGVKLEKY